MNTKILIAAIIAGIGVPIVVYAASPLFINTTIDEPLPTNIMKKDEKMMGENMEKEMTEEKAMLKEEMMESEATLEEMTEKMIEEKMMEKEMMDKTMEEKMEEEMMEEEMMEKTMEEKMMEKETKSNDSEEFSAKSGVFVGVGDGIHDAQGNALVLPLEDGQKVLRLEDFRATNGPDLYVYLATDSGASDYVSLGRLKANIGNQNYDIPAGTDLSKYDNVLIWCKQFSVLFGSAELQ